MHDTSFPTAPSLTRDELREFADRLASEPERWAHLMVGDDLGQRAYELVWDDGQVNAWAIRWSEDADTGFHDHDESAAAIAVIAGEVREDRLSVTGLPRARLFGPGETFTLEANAIHRVLHSGVGPALTVHAYSPPLRRTGAYTVEPDGVLTRESQSFEVELRGEPAVV